MTPYTPLPSLNCLSNSFSPQGAGSLHSCSDFARMVLFPCHSMQHQKACQMPIFMPIIHKTLLAHVLMLCQLQVKHLLSPPGVCVGFQGGRALQGLPVAGKPVHQPTAAAPAPVLALPGSHRARGEPCEPESVPPYPGKALLLQLSPLHHW